MKNDNPLSQAVKARVKAPEKAADKKTISIPAADVPRGMAVGKSIRIMGTIESLDENDATVAVTSIEDDAVPKEAPVMRVMTQESHA